MMLRVACLIKKNTYGKQQGKEAVKQTRLFSGFEVIRDAVLAATEAVTEEWSRQLRKSTDPWKLKLRFDSKNLCQLICSLGNENQIRFWLARTNSDSKMVTQ